MFDAGETRKVASRAKQLGTSRNIREHARVKRSSLNIRSDRNLRSRWLRFAFLPTVLPHRRSARARSCAPSDSTYQVPRMISAEISRPFCRMRKAGVFFPERKNNRRAEAES